MAIFANASYSDPIRALTIKALEKRQADLAAAQAKEEVPTSMPSPWQGLAHVAGSIGGAMQQSRAENALAQRRADLAKLVAGVNPETGPDQQTLAGIMGADPDLGTKYLEMAVRAREAAKARQQAVEDREDTQRHGVDTAATLAQTQAAAAREAADRASLLEQQRAEEKRQQDLDAANRTAAENEKNRLAQEKLNVPEAVKMRRALEKGEIDQPTYDAWVKKNTAPSISDQKAAGELKAGHIEQQSSLDSLYEAQNLLNAGIYHGTGGGLRQIAGKWLPDALGGAVAGTDEETTKRTEQWNRIVASGAIDDMARRLKGANTEKEMEAFMRINADPNSTKETKQAALSQLIRKVEAHLTAQGETLRASGVDVPKLKSYRDEKPTLSDADKAAAIEAARAAIASGKSKDAVLKRLRENGIPVEGL